MEAWRLAVGTLTAIPVRPPSGVDRTTTRRAMLLAPLAVVPLGVLVAVTVWLGQRLELPALGIGFVAVGVLALGSRAFHLDGLSDVTDGLTASYDPARSLAVMKSGTSGPAGTVAIVVVLGAQAAGVAALAGPGPSHAHPAIVVGLLVCISRCALALTCVRGVPAARQDGLGTPFVGCVPRTAALATWIVAAVVVGATATWSDVDGQFGRGVVTTIVAVVVVGLLVHRAVRRFGGVTGDVFGAAIELTLAVLLLGMT